MILSAKRAAAVSSLAILVGLAMRGSPVAAQAAIPDSAQVSLQESDVSLDGHLSFDGRGFAAGEPASVTIEDGQGGLQAQLEPVKAEADGQVYRVSVQVPPGLAPGAHTVRLTGATSGKFGRATFNLRWQTPAVHLDSYTGKPNQTLGFQGSGFVPGESVDVFLGDQTSNPLATVAADGKGDITSDNVGVPNLGAGDYKVSFIGRTSGTPVSVGFNIQGIHPWVVLHNYYVAREAAVGFNGADFVPGEAVQVYLNNRLSPPVAQVTADAEGHFAVEQAFSRPDLSGDNELIFVGQQSQTEVTVTFSIATP